MRIKGSYALLSVFVGAYLLGFGSMALRGGNNEFLLYGIVMIVLIVLVLAIHRRVGFSDLVLWLLALWGLLHMAGGTVHAGDSVLYALRLSENLPRYDQAVHAFGFFVATLASLEALGAAVHGRRGHGARMSAGLCIAGVLMGMGLGAANEIVEFAATRLLPETNVGGYVNTGWDLVSNGIGATAAGLIVYLRGSRGT